MTICTVQQIFMVKLILLLSYDCRCSSTVIVKIQVCFSILQGTVLYNGYYKFQYDYYCKYKTHINVETLVMKYIQKTALISNFLFRNSVM